MSDQMEEVVVAVKSAVDCCTKDVEIPVFETQCGRTLSGLNACYTIYGDLNNGKKLALFFHGFSSDSKLHTWWQKFNFAECLQSYNIICINSLGSSYGTTGPESIDPTNGSPYGSSFPDISVQDTVNFTVVVLEKLGVDQIDMVFGCSLGGMQVLDLWWRYPDIAKQFVSVAACSVPHMTQMVNLAQARLIDQAVGQGRQMLQAALGMSRFFFRLSCTNETALAVLNQKQDKGKGRRPIERLEQYFVEDNLKFQTEFSPFSNSLYLKLIANFELEMDKGGDYKRPSIKLVSMQDDQFTPASCVSQLATKLANLGQSVLLSQFNTKFGHEAWIVDGEQFYEFIKKDLYS